MKYDWAQVVKQFNHYIVANVEFVNRPDLQAHFKAAVLDCGQFHPYGSDGMLSQLLDRIPSRCNYRSLKSYRAYREGRTRMVDALDEMLYEVEDRIRDYYADKWNFAFGYCPPSESEIVFLWEDSSSTDRLAARIHRMAK